MFFQRIKSFLLYNKNTRQTVAKNTFWLSVSQLGSRLIRAVIIIYAARVLGAGEYGIFNYVLGFAGFFTLFADVGINSLLTRDIAQNPEKRAEFFSNSFWIKIGLLAITAILVIFVAPHFTSIKEAQLLIPLVAILVIADGIREFCIAFLRGIEKMEAEAFIVTIMNISIMVAGFVILSINQTAKALLITYITSVVVTSSIALIMLRKYFAQIFLHIKKERIFYVLRSAWPIAFAGIFGILMLNTDTIMLGWWVTPEQIGYYSAGQRIIQVLYTLPALLASATFPALSRAIQKKNHQQEKVVNEKSMTLIYAIGAPLITGGLLTAKPLISLLFGPEYLPGTLAFQILLVGILIQFPGVFLSNLVIARNKQKKAILFTALGAFTNIGLNILLIPPFGIAGCAAATFVSLLSNFGLLWIFLKKDDNFQILPNIKKIITATVIMTVATILLIMTNLSVLIVIALAAIIYLLSLFLLKEKIIKDVATLSKETTFPN